MARAERLRGVAYDRFPLWLEAVEITFNRLGHELVRKTTKRTAAIEAVEELKPDVFVMGIEVRGTKIEGLETIREVARRAPSVLVIAMGEEGRPETVQAVFRAGASSYVVKTALPDDLAAAIRQVYSHEVYYAYDRPPAESASDERPRNHRGDTAQDDEPVERRMDESKPTEAPAHILGKLTRREFEILRLTADGRSNAELAKVLWVTEQTVKFHLSNIYRKLGVRNRTQASLWAQVHGLTNGVTPSSPL